MAEYTGTCKQCGNEFISSRSHAEFCSNKCRAAYSRALKKGSAETHGAFSEIPPAHEQAISDDETKEILRLLASDMASVKAILIALTGGQSLESQKKSDFVPGQTTFTPPTEKPVVREIDPEVAKRKTVQNTLSALDDF